MQKPVQSQKIYWRQKLLQFILMPPCRFSHNAYLHHASELPNWDKSDKIFRQIILVASKAEGQNQKPCFYYFGNFDENMRRPHEKDPPRIGRLIKKPKSKLFELIAWQRDTWPRYLPPTKIKWNKIFLWASKRRKAWKIFENQYKIFENHDIVQKQRKYGLPSIIFSIFWFKFNPMKFTLYFCAVISYQSLFSVCCYFQNYSRVVCFK